MDKKSGQKPKNFRKNGQRKMLKNGLEVAKNGHFRPFLGCFEVI